MMLKPEERRVIFFQDSDPQGHPARNGLDTGVDALIMAGKQVRITEDSERGDANQILQTGGLGEQELRRLLSKPAAAPLSFAGTAEELSKLSETEYMKARREAARNHKVPVSFLDREVAKRRPKPSEDEEDSPAGGLSVPADLPLTEDEILPPLDVLLDTIDQQFGRFIAISREQRTTAVLWAAAAHLVHSQKLDLQLFPKLAIQSKEPASGKTTLLTLIWNCLPRAKLWTFPTGAYLVRALQQARFSLCLDELQYAEDKNLLRVINCSQHKPLAYVPLLVPDHKGAYIPHEFFVWAPMALARLGEFSTAQQTRSIVVWMMPKLRGEKHERLRRPIVPELVLCRRQLAAWADNLEEWADPEIPKALLNRDIDNWVPLLFVAQQAGGEWPALAANAVEAVMKIESRPTVTVRLLASIWRGFQPLPDVDPENDFLPSRELLAKLIGDEEESWDTVNVAGKPITFEWLRERLSNLLDPPGSQSRFYYDADGVRRHERGYSFAQFKNAFARYLDDEHPSAYRFDDAHTDKYTHADRPGSPGSGGAAGQKAKDSAEASAPGSRPGENLSGSEPGAAVPSKSADLATSEPGEPGEPGSSGSLDIDVSLASEPLKKSRSSVRSQRPKRNGGVPVARKRAAPQLDLPETPVVDYSKGLIADDIRQLRVTNPKRSIKWIAQQSGQSPSVVRGILGNGEGSE